jgi:hypothetical protein
MHAQRKDRRGDLIPVIVAAIVAVVGTAAILFNDFGPGSPSMARKAKAPSQGAGPLSGNTGAARIA